MTTSYWGPPCWNLLHTLSYKIKDYNEFELIKDDFWNILVSICTNLPCPICKEHATKLILSANKNKILQSNRNLQLFLIDFHNKVNTNKYKPIFSIEKADNIYIHFNTKNVVLAFMTTFNVKYRNIRLMNNTFHKNTMMNTFIQWININQKYFNP
jgi:hypothetical protein